MVRFEDRNRGPKRFDRKPRRDSRDFDREDDFDRPRNFERRDSRPKRRDSRSRDRGEMTKAVCDKCGKSCEVPFRPTPGKPIYCDECFGKNSSSSGSNSQLEEINKKLDKILKLLE